MLKKLLIFVSIIVNSATSFSQKKDPVTDTTLNYDDLFTELDSFIDSITAPQTFVVLDIGITNQHFNFFKRNNVKPNTTRVVITNPTLGYYNKNGLGLTAGAAIVQENNKFNPYQFSLALSYDFVKNIDFVTGINYTRYFTKDSLPFYTTPLNNAISAYFTYRDSWFKPSLSVNYGWGSKSEFEEREEQIQLIRLISTGYTRVDTRESINDFSLVASIRHDFYFLDWLGEKSYAKFTPQINFISGTQKFGFNQNTQSFGTKKGNGRPLLYNSQNTQLDEELKFQPLSLAAFLKTEVGYGKFYLQPQLMFDYYFPAEDNNFSTAFAVNIGVSF